MSSVYPSHEQRLRLGLQLFNRFMVLLWQLGLGPWVNLWPDVGGRTMVICHAHGKTRLRRRTPVNYAIVDGEIYCTAAFGEVTDWFRNLKTNPEVEVWLPDGWWAGIAEEVTDGRMRVPLLRQVLIASGFVARASGIDAHTMTNEALDSATRGYRVVHVHRTRACTGRGGPGGLAWVWQGATAGLLLMALFRRNKR